MTTCRYSIKLIFYGNNILNDLYKINDFNHCCGLSKDTQRPKTEPDGTVAKLDMTLVLIHIS